MAATRAQKLDMKHGFMKSIIKNQVDRDNYDKEVRATKQNKRGFNLHNSQNRSKKPDAAVYIPPPRKEATDPEHNEEIQSEKCNSHNHDSKSQNTQSERKHPNSSQEKPSCHQLHSTSPIQPAIQPTQQSHVQETTQSHVQETTQSAMGQQTESQYSDEDDEPKLLFIFEFEDKDGKQYKQYIKEGVRAEVLAQRMGYDRRLPAPMIKALEKRLQEEIDKRTASKH